MVRQINRHLNDLKLFFKREAKRHGRRLSKTIKFEGLCVEILQFVDFFIFQDETASNNSAQPPAPSGKSKAAKMRAVARTENTAGSGKAEQELLLKLYETFCFFETI